MSYRYLDVVIFAVALIGLALPALAADSAGIATGLTPQPQKLTLDAGVLRLHGQTVQVHVPEGTPNDACADVLADALRIVGAKPVVARGAAGSAFAIGDDGGAAPPAPEHGDEAYSLQITPTGAGASAASPAGLLHAAQTFRQLARLSVDAGQVPCLAISDYPAFPLRGIYIEGGQERFGRVVQKDYLIDQIRQLSAFHMNALVIECYNLFPFPSFPACTDAGTLSPADCKEIVAVAKRYHVTIIPSLMTLAQAYELVWGNEVGKPYREETAPGMMCPSNPAIYPFIKALYKDLLTLFDDSPMIGIGCSEIDMQWQNRFCPRCAARVKAGETARSLLLGHAEKCIQAVREVSAELGRPIRPMIWGDEFYMYGPGRDWVGMERIPKDTIVGFWKYWQDYKAIGELMKRGYDVVGISAMYNHCFYLADISPEDPKKVWPVMEQTGVRNITEMVQDAYHADPHARGEQATGPKFWGVATASFSKHRIRAFDTIWYGFALNGHCQWSHPGEPLPDYQPAFTRAFVRHYYDCRSDRAAATLADAFERLDRCKSQLELANQTLHDVVGVVDTQEAGYMGNTLMGAYHRADGLLKPSGEPTEALVKIRAAAVATETEAAEMMKRILACQGQVGRATELGDLWLAGEKIAAHAEREALLIDTAEALAKAAKASASPEGRGTHSGAFAAARWEVAALAERWETHRERTERILHRVKPLYQQGDPTGFVQMLSDIRGIEAHLQRVSAEAVAAPGAQTKPLLQEVFAAIDPARWIVRGKPEAADGHLLTAAPGGWENFSGVTTKQSFALEDAHPLVVEFDVTPVKLGIGSQLFGGATERGDLTYRFCFFGRTDRFGIYTACAKLPSDAPALGEPGWQPRAMSPEVKAGDTYHVRADITRRGLRVIVHGAKDDAWRIPFWDSGTLPMDDLAETRLMFSDDEPPNSTASTKWGAISIGMGE